MRTMYEVAVHTHGRKRITSDCPAQGLLEWPEHRWGRITARPIGISRAKALADAQETHATVQILMTAEKVYDNGKAPLVPSVPGQTWFPAEATR